MAASLWNVSQSFTAHPYNGARSTTALLSSSVECSVPEVEIVSAMPDPLPMDLKNNYYLLRHGQSTANVAGIISSSRSLAYSSKHGLTPTGYEQGYESSTQLLNLLEEEGAGKLIFVSSPFARAHQTAQACLDGLLEQHQEALAAKGIELDTSIRLEVDLMERYFGRLDGEQLYTYAYVWPVDGFDVTQTGFGVESVAAVATRLRRTIAALEEEHSNTNICLVSHADVLQICQLYGANAENVGKFSCYRFNNGEVRAMQRTPDSLPEPSPLQPLIRTTKTQAT